MYSKAIDSQFIHSHNALMRWLKLTSCDELYEQVKNGTLLFEAVLAIFERIEYDKSNKKLDGGYFDFTSFSFQFFEKKKLTQDEISTCLRYFAQRELLVDIIRTNEFQKLIEKNAFCEQNVREIVALLRVQQKFKDLLEIRELCSYAHHHEVVEWIEQLKKEHRLRELFKVRVVQNIMSASLMTSEDFHDIFMAIDKSESAMIDVINICDRNETLLFLVLSNILTFRELLDKTAEFDLHEKLFCNEVFDIFLKKNVISEEDLKYVYEVYVQKQGKSQHIHRVDVNLLSFEQQEKLTHFSDRTVLLQKLFEDRVLHSNNFNKFVQLLKKFDNLGLLLNDVQLFDVVVKKKLLTNQNIIVLLKSLQKYRNFEQFVKNIPLLKHCLKNSLITRSVVEKTASSYRKQLKSVGVSNVVDAEELFFNLISLVYDEHDQRCEEFRKNCIKNGVVQSKKEFEEILLMSEVAHLILLDESKRAHPLTRPQKQKLFEAAQKSKKAFNNLQHLVDGNLSTNYDFSELKKLISKDDHKKRLKLNF